MRPRAICLSLWLGAAALFAPTLVSAASHNPVVQPIDFGTIIVDSASVAVEINAVNGPAAPRIVSGGLAQVNGGTSGLVRVYSDLPGQSLTLVYQEPVDLKHGAFTF